MIRIVTDNASDIRQDEADEMDITVIELPISFGEEAFPQRTLEDFQNFYRKLEQVEKLPKTSRASIGDYLSLYQKAEQEGDDIIVITLSSGLSGTIESALQAKEVSGYDRIYVVDSEQAITNQRLLVEYACKLRKNGFDAESIVEKLEAIKKRIVVYGMIDTLKYLEMGGRIPTGFANIGNTLKIKPLITMNHGKLEAMSIVRGSKAGIKKIKKQFEKDGYDSNFPVYFAYTPDKKYSLAFQKEMEESYGLTKTKNYPVCGVVGSHIGPNGLAIIFVKEN